MLNPCRIEASSSMLVPASSQPDSPPEPFVMLFPTESPITDLSAFRLFGKFSMKGVNEKLHFIRLQTMDCKRSIAGRTCLIPQFLLLVASKSVKQYSPKYLMVGKTN